MEPKFVVIEEAMAVDLSELTGGECFRDDKGRIFLLNTAPQYGSAGQAAPGQFYVTELSNEYAVCSVFNNQSVTPVRVAYVSRHP